MIMTRPEEEAALYVLLHDLRCSHAEIRDRVTEGELPIEILRGQLAASAKLDLFEEDPIAKAIEQITQWRGYGFYVLTPFTRGYPSQLSEVHDRPMFLFGVGDLLDDSRSVAIVGSRNASEAAKSAASDIATELACRGVTIVSGLAKGIDTAAHTAALRTAGGRTVAVLGNGIDKFYPAENKALQLSIADSGLLLSQFWPGSSGTRATYPMRNITMSAYSGATIIMEAGEKSGTRHQAKAAVNHGRPLLLASSVARGTSWGREYASAGLAIEFKTPAQAASIALDVLRAAKNQVVPRAL